MILLRLISWPYFRKHVLRTLLTTAGIVLGVAVFVGMHTANQSVLFAFNSTVDRIAGKTELQVSAGEAGFDEAILERVQSAASVRVAVPVIEAVVDTQLTGQGSLLVLGTDMTGDRSLRDYDLDDADEAMIDDPLVFLAQADSIMLTREFANRNGIAVNGRVQVGTVLGPREFTVRGIMKSSGLSSAFGGNLAVMDIYAAQRMFGRGRTFDRIDLATQPGTTLAQAQEELRGILGPGFEVDTPSGRGRQFESITAAYSIMVSISSVFALFIGMFIIYNSFSIAVTQRRSEIGILRALGATGGLVLGLLIARSIAATIGALMKDVYGVAQRADDIATNPMLLAAALAVGVVTSVIAALIPARQAARVDPVQALQKGKYQTLSAAESRVRLITASILATLSLVCLTVQTSRVVFYVGYAGVIVLALLLGPVLALGLSRGLRPLLKRLRPIEGALAADSLIQSPRRTSACVAALMLSLALVTAFAGMARASYLSITEWLNTALNPDLFISPAQDIVVRTLRFPAEMAGELAAIPGIARVQKVRNARIVYRGTPVMIVATEIASLSQTAPQPTVEGSQHDMYSRTAGGTGLMVSDNFARLQHVHLGDAVEIPAPYGTIRLPIAGIVVDYSDQQGSILMDLSLYEKYWKDDSVNVFRLYLTGGASVSAVKERILTRYAGERQVFVLTNGDVKSYILRVTDQWFSLTSIQIAVAVLVAILGIVNTLTVSIIDRRRELGVLKAVGGVGSQIRRTIWMEAVSIGTLGLILGFGLGAVNLYYILQIAEHDIAGMRLDYVFPVSMAFSMVPTILGAAFAAALWPAESAVRGSLVEALEYE
jgi:putative ABC transport system permease protein